MFLIVIYRVITIASKVVVEVVVEIGRADIFLAIGNAFPFLQVNHDGKARQDCVEAFIYPARSRPSYQVDVGVELQRSQPTQSPTLALVYYLLVVIGIEIKL